MLEAQSLSNNPTNGKIVLIFSGGLDSTVLFQHLRVSGHEVWPLTFNYGQRHKREIAAAEAICAKMGEFMTQRHKVVDISHLGGQLLSGSSQTTTGIPVPHGHYADESMKVTVVPNRNLIMLSLAVGYAISINAKGVAYAAHAGDHAIYPDCRPEFINAAREVFRLVHYTPIDLLDPFAQWTKALIVEFGEKIFAPLGLTYSCYEGGELHCGRCGTCVERREAFKLAEVDDPTPYANEEVVG